MKSKLNELKNVKSENCVTLILNTHRTKPDNLQDAIALKNLISEAESRLVDHCDKRIALDIVGKLQAIENQMDHNYNLESLILFANENTMEFIRLPISVEPRVIIDSSFATRDLVRAMHQESNYYILLLSQQKARLMEAFNDKLVQEYSGAFPMENTTLFTTTGAEQSNANRQTNLTLEFFNRIDKEVNNIRSTHPLKVLLCTEESNFYEYQKIADQNESLLEIFHNKNWIDEKAHQVVSDSWELVKSEIEAKNNARIEALNEAVNSGKFLSDVNDILLALQDGRVQTLLIEEGLFHSGIIHEKQIELVDADRKNEPNVVDDIYDELIERNQMFGGDVVFLPDGKLEKFHRFAAIVRY